MNLIFGTLILVWNNFKLDMIYFCICSLILIYSGKTKRFIKFLIFYLICLYIVFYIKLPDDSFFSFIGFISYSNVKMCPTYMIASFIVLDIRTSELIYVLGKLGFGKKIRFACTITLKFIPIYFAEKRIIKSALKLRGIDVSFTKPIKRFEYYIVPTLFRASNIANEMKIQESLNKLIKNKTVLVISHRMKSIENANKIIVMENGKIESQGNHNELLEKSKVYNTMVKNSNLAENYSY